MGSSFRIARIFGIDVSITPSWLLFFAFMTYTVAGYFRYEPWSTATLWSVAVVASLLLFASVLVHELAHSFVARAQGIAVHGITLWLLGGVSTIASEATSPGREAVLAGVGPLSSLVIGVACFLGARVAPASSVVEAVLVYLGFINVALAVFNMLPGYPLDGSKVLHAALWRFARDPVRATRWAARAGVVIGAGLIAYGFIALVLLHFSYFVAIWAAFIGWFVLQASQGAVRQSRAEGSLADVSVGRVMTVPPAAVPDDITLRKAASDYFAPLGARCLPVLDDGGLLTGMICLSDLGRTDESAWGVDQVRDAMTPHDRLPTIGPDEPASAAFHRLVTTDAEYLAVVQNGRLIGFIDRTGIVNYVQGGHPARPAAGAART